MHLRMIPIMLIEIIDLWSLLSPRLALVGADAGRLAVLVQNVVTSAARSGGSRRSGGGAGRTRGPARHRRRRLPRRRPARSSPASRLIRAMPRPALARSGNPPPGAGRWHRGTPRTAG